MLQEIIELQERAVSQLVDKVDKKREITFRAPTGSGKTFMMADLMNRILSKENDIVFLVSTLSKGGLAEQNYSKFVEYSTQGLFKALNPLLIKTDVSGEERIHIPDGHNVYVLPRDLYKEGGLLMQGAMIDFLQRITTNIFGTGLNKRIFVIKDECHQATNNLDTLAPSFFSKIINFSATPNLSRGQNPDVEITDEEAVDAKLIKRIERGEETDTVEDAINKFEDIKEAYRNYLGVNPCLIIQISNKEKAEEELNNIILPVLDKIEHQDLKWMIIVDKDKNKNKPRSSSPLQRMTNDSVGKKLPQKRWKDYAKSNTSTIDIIIFKMVISEGWDIPRACMLYQVRDTTSVQLDEQVMGRVRRNPRLLDFEDLSDEAKDLATTAWIWGIMPESQRRTYTVRLKGETTTSQQVRIQTTRLRPLSDKKTFDLEAFLDNTRPVINHHSIFDLHRKMYGQDAMISLCYKYATDVEKWWRFTEHFDSIKAQYEQYICDYSESMELVTDENGNKKTVSFPLESLYVETDKYLQISDWVWKRKEGVKKFSFDSEAEKEWAEILKDISRDAAKELSSTPEDPKLFDDEGHNIPRICLWGKNFPNGSDIKFGYYLNGLHDSYPDFVFVDKKGIIHLFEVKSLNVKKDSNIDAAEYQNKVLALKNCYKQCSILTEHVFYLPVLKDDEWQITRFIKGDEKTLSEDQFRDSLLED